MTDSGSVSSVGNGVSTNEGREQGLQIEGLRLEVASSGADIVDEVNLTIAPGTVLGLVGESGSGKTTVGLAVLGHARKGVRIAAGRVSIGEFDVLALPPNALRALRGSQVSYVPQDPSSSLNPALRIEVQLREVLEAHSYGATDAERTDRVREMMTEVALPDDDQFLRRYPHQLSGGQQQRVGLAMAFACRPSVIVLDEPTTGLDVSTQAHVLDTIRTLTKLHRVAALYITHDLAVVADLADEVAVMYAGRMMEHASAKTIFTSPQHPYTQRLMRAAPDISGESELTGLPGRAPSPGKRPDGCFFAARCDQVIDACRVGQIPLSTVGESHSLRCIRPGSVMPAAIPRRPSAADTDLVSVLTLNDVSAGYQGNRVVHNVSFQLLSGQCVAVVGESGSGKTTLSRSIGGLHREWSGTISLHGESLASGARQRSDQQRQKIQYVFQNPYASLNPRRTVGDSIARPLRVAGVSEHDARQAAGLMLERVSLATGYLDQYPNQLSGGERQRVAIARALVSKPDVLVCDEVTSALDVLVQAAIVELLGNLQRDLGLSMIFVTHNLPLVRSIADQVAVLHQGSLVEFGTTESVIGNPSNEYTQRLIADTPSISSLVGPTRS